MAMTAWSAKVFSELDLLVGERSDLWRGDRDGADRRAGADHRHGELARGIPPGRCWERRIPGRRRCPPRARRGRRAWRARSRCLGPAVGGRPVGRSRSISGSQLWWAPRWIGSPSSRNSPGRRGTERRRAPRRSCRTPAGCRWASCEMTRRISLVAVCCSSAVCQLSVARLELLAQALVLEGDRRLVGEGPEESDLLRGERSNSHPADGDEPDGEIAPQERDGQDATKRMLAEVVEPGVPPLNGGRPDVADVDRLPVEDRMAARQAPGDRHGPADRAHEGTRRRGWRRPGGGRPPRGRCGRRSRRRGARRSARWPGGWPGRRWTMELRRAARGGGSAAAVAAGAGRLASWLREHPWMGLRESGSRPGTVGPARAEAPKVVRRLPGVKRRAGVRTRTAPRPTAGSRPCR